MGAYNRPFVAAVKRTRRGGVISVHRFGTDGDWTQAPCHGDTVLVVELVTTSEDMHCRDCASIVTGLRDPATGILQGIGIPHAPGCPWLTARTAA